MKTQTFAVPDMHCSACVIKLEGIEDELVGIEYVDANYKKQKMVACYDESKVSEQDIIEAVKKEGYTAKPEEK